MKMYLVRRYVDGHQPGDYGVDDAYYAIGLFSSEELAYSVMETEKALLPTGDNTTEIDILPIEVDKIYEGEAQIYLGGGFYIE